ncbi:hypothetical protein K438DRAFT_1797662 [Mycena galopus ATCC 62051]|nr:hypothetical protein K438DRAFT_1797662 [Mycena galopus ATCC 62051]
MVIWFIYLQARTTFAYRGIFRRGVLVTSMGLRACFASPETPQWLIVMPGGLERSGSIYMHTAHAARSDLLRSKSPWTQP